MALLTCSHRTKNKRFQGKTKVAIIYLTGGIVDGEEPPFTTDRSIYSLTAARNIRLAAQDKKVAAILLRVSSGGGSAVASDVIAREIDLAKKEGKKIIVSMGSVAGSGGYWISTRADKIVCDKYGITGSIGVLSGKFNVRGTMNHLGVTFDHVQSNSKSTMYSQLFGYSKDEHALVNHIIDFYYDQFLNLVSETRKIDKEQLRKLAKGQIYLGPRAKELLLVDELGGLSKAIEVTKELLGLKKEQDIDLQQFPTKKSLLQILAAASSTADNSDERDKKQASVSSMVLPAFSWMNVLNRFQGLVPLLQPHSFTVAAASALHNQGAIGIQFVAPPVFL
jgi:protease-4